VVNIHSGTVDDPQSFHTAILFLLQKDNQSRECGETTRLTARQRYKRTDTGISI